MSTERTKEAICSDIQKLIQELVNLEDSEMENDSHLVTGWVIGGTGVRSTASNGFRAIYFESLELNPILAAGIADYVMSRSREKISKRIHDGKQE